MVSLIIEWLRNFVFINIFIPDLFNQMYQIPNIVIIIIIIIYQYNYYEVVAWPYIGC